MSSDDFDANTNAGVDSSWLAVTWFIDHDSAEVADYTARATGVARQPGVKALELDGSTDASRLISPG